MPGTGSREIRLATLKGQTIKPSSDRFVRRCRTRSALHPGKAPDRTAGSGATMGQIGQFFNLIQMLALFFCHSESYEVRQGSIQCNVV